LTLLLYPSFLGLVNGVMQPLVTATGSMVQNGQQSVQVMLEQQQQLPSTDTASESLLDEIGAKLDYKTIVEQGVASFLEWIYEGAALIISILRTFILTVLSILGTLALGLSVLDGFRSSFQHWLARYISVSLWLPVANIYGAIIARVQVLMLQQDASGNFAHGHGGAYIIFLLMGIVGYACVPSTAGYVVHTMGGHALVSKVNTAAVIARTL
jgi:conjugative transposon TraJ protein